MCCQIGLLTQKLHLSNNDSKHMCIKTFTKQDLDIPGYQFVIYENMTFAGYQMPHKGAAGKAFSAPMPIYIAVFGLRYAIMVYWPTEAVRTISLCAVNFSIVVRSKLKTCR
jgi:hypothetical protein